MSHLSEISLAQSVAPCSFRPKIPVRGYFRSKRPPKRPSAVSCAAAAIPSGRRARRSPSERTRTDEGTIAVEHRVAPAHRRRVGPGPACFDPTHCPAFPQPRPSFRRWAVEARAFRSSVVIPRASSFLPVSMPPSPAADRWSWCPVSRASARRGPPLTCSPTRGAGVLLPRGPLLRNGRRAAVRAVRRDAGIQRALRAARRVPPRPWRRGGSAVSKLMPDGRTCSGSPRAAAARRSVTVRPL